MSPPRPTLHPATQFGRPPPGAQDAEECLHLLSPHFADVHVMLFRISAYAQYQVTPNHQKKSANVSMARPGRLLISMSSPRRDGGGTLNPGGRSARPAGSLMRGL